MAKIHFFWAGHQKTTDIRSPGMDMSGPLEMARWNLNTGKKHTVYFWCPENLRDAYNQLIPIELGIQIKVCEDLFAPLPTDDQKDKWAKNRLQFLFSELIKTESTRAWVCAKNVFSIALLYFEGGYFADSTIFPTPPTSLPDYNSLKVILIDTTRDFYFAKIREGSFQYSEPHNEMILPDPSKAMSNPLLHRPDIFFMYSPERHHMAWRALEYIIFIYPNCLESISKKSIDVAYNSCPSIILMALMDAIYHADSQLFHPDLAKKYEAYFFHISWSSKTSCYIHDPFHTGSLNLIKNFNKTHDFTKANERERGAFREYLTKMSNFFQNNRLIWLNPDNLLG